MKFQVSRNGLKDHKALENDLRTDILQSADATNTSCSKDK